MERVKTYYHKARGNESVMQAGSFGVVGVINTVVDFAVFNISSLAFGLPVVPANIVSTTVAQIGSFLLNRQLVFKAHGILTWRTVAKFLAVTMVGLYVIQGVVIYIFTHPLPLPGVAVAQALHGIGIHHFETNVIVMNIAKVIATVASAVWNFVWYKKVVFKKSVE